MATKINTNATKSLLSIDVDKTDYPSAIYPAYIDIAVASLKMEMGAGFVELIITDTSNTQQYKFSTANGTIDVNSVTALDNLDIRTKIQALI